MDLGPLGRRTVRFRSDLETRWRDAAFRVRSCQSVSQELSLTARVEPAATSGGMEKP
jgi:hypothetical protein